MNCNEINKLMDDYLDDLLDPKVKKDFEESIKYCSEQETILKKHKLLEKKIIDLPLSFNPSEKVFDELKESLLEVVDVEKEENALTKKATKLAETKNEESSGTDYSRSRKLKRNRKKKKLPTFLIILSVILITTIFGVYYFFYIYNNTSPWKFNLTNGVAFVNQTKVDRTNLYPGDNIILNDSSHAKITLPGEFEIDLYSNSKLRILDARATINQIEMVDGSINFKTVSNESNFILKHGPIKLNERSGIYSYTTDEFGNVKVDVKNGIVDFITPRGNFSLANDYSVFISDNFRVSIPVHKEASPKFLSEINRLNVAVNDIAALSSLMLETKQTDVLTLIRILELVTSDKRELVFQKIRNMFPPPAGVTKNGILEGNKRMLEKWWSEIEAQI
jgi:hypothetical protein